MDIKETRMALLLALPPTQQPEDASSFQDSRKLPSDCTPSRYFDTLSEPAQASNLWYGTTEVACAMAGHSKKESIPLDDIKAVRSCGRKVVEHFRRLAIEVHAATPFHWR